MKTALSLILLLVLTACQNPEQAALVAVTVTNSAADTAAGAYLDYCEHSIVPPATNAKIVRAARNYQAAKTVAQVSVLAWKYSQTADNKTKADAAKQALSDAASSLVSLIREFNPSLIKP